jgi:hypothetical protein
MNRLQAGVLSGLVFLLSSLQALAGPPQVLGRNGPPAADAASARPLLVVANGSGASLGVFAIGEDGAPQEVPGSPFPALAGVDTVRFCGEQTLVTSASSGPNIGDPSTLEVFHVTTAGRLEPGSGVVPIPKDVRPWASVRRGARSFLFVPAAGLPGDRLYGFEITGQGSALSLDPLPWSPQPLAGLMLTGGAAATPLGEFLYQVGYSNSMSAYAIGADGSLTAFDVHNAAIGQLTNAVVSSDGRHLYCPRDFNPDHLAGFAIGPGGGLTALPGSPYPLAPASNDPTHVATTPDGRFVIGGSGGGGVITVFARSPNGNLSSVPGGILSFAECPGAVACDDERLFVIADDAFDTRRVFVYRFASLQSGPVHSVPVPPDARDLALSRAGP